MQRGTTPGFGFISHLWGWVLGDVYCSSDASFPIQAGTAWTFRLLAAMLQGSDEFAASFQEADGFRALATCLPRHAASLPILLSALALALGVPVAALPATGEGMDATSILSLLRRNAGTATGPAGVAGLGSGSRAGDQPRPFVRVCVAKVLLPALRSNAALLRRAKVAGVVVTAPTANSLSSASTAAAREGESTGARASGRSGGGGGGAAGGEASEVSEWIRAKMASEIISAAVWEALMNDPSFRLTCRSADVVGALVDVLGGTWDEPEVDVGRGGNNNKKSDAGVDELEREGEMEGAAIGGSAAVGENDVMLFKLFVSLTSRACRCVYVRY